MRVLLVVLLLAGSCDRGRREVPPPPPPVTDRAPAAHTLASCTLKPLATAMAMPKRAVAIGDLHGDLQAARAALRTAGAIDDRDAWIGNDLVVIQLGDVLDRGDDESKILDLLETLAQQARAHGGDVIQLLGNHELMNAAGDFRYVTRGGAADFHGDRQHELAPGGTWAKRLANHNVIAIVGDTVLSHAGITGAWMAKVDATNLTSRCWLDGQAGGASDPPPALANDDSPVWTRAWGHTPADCAALTAVLDAVHAKRMVVAHTVQQGGITSDCDGTLWRIDVGLAKLYGGPIQVLELGPPPRILTGSRLQ